VLAHSPWPQFCGVSVKMSRFINSIAEFLSTAQGFITTFVLLLLGIAIGVLVQFNEGFMFGFNLLLSVAAIVISGVILVAGARSEAALHVKLDYLIEYSKATNDAIGIEHKDVHEIEKERERVEAEVKGKLDDMVEEEVREEVAEQLGRREKA
jgi:low affinity Fe/Cu permease